MPEIKPFRAWRYQAQKIKNYAAVVAPPYDIISKEEQEKLYSVSPFNVIRMELGQKLPNDSDQNNPYTRAREFMDSLKSQGVIGLEDKPSLYVHVQDYQENGKKKTRLGFFAAMKLDEKAVLKHENTLTGPKEDRLHLLKAVKTNLSPIFGLFEDKPGVIDALLKPAVKKDAVSDVTIKGVRHRLFIENRDEIVKKIVSKMKSKPMFIADGHHRFEVACQYRRWMNSSPSRDPKKDNPWNYVLTYFSDCHHNPFKIYPTHRLIKFSQNIDPIKELTRLGTVRGVKNLDQILQELKDSREEVKDKAYKFGFYSKKTGFQLVTLSKKGSGSTKNPVERLDVSVLHRRIIDPVFGIKAIEKSDAIDFTRDAYEALEKVQKGIFDGALFLRPTSLGEMLFVSKKGLKMPQKSTYFYPKLLTGLLFYGLDEEKS